MITIKVMKARLIIASIFFMMIAGAKAQVHYETIADSEHPGNKILKGIINKDILKNDTSYKWYSDNQKIYMHPDSALVNAFERNKDRAHYIIFGGTWCEDTQFILPKFFILQEKAGISNDSITFYAVDRNKQTTGNTASLYNIVNVPAIIVLRDGKEVGRVVEYGKTGKWDKELADILNL
ncbi:MAG: thioredoxin family protein [Ginsengibacter sp.]